MKLLKQADFSQETDLKDRLRRQLFPGNVQAFPLRQALDDDDADLICAAGSPDFEADKMRRSPLSGADR